MAPMSVTMLGAFAFVFVVFFYSSAAGGVDDETLVNRLLLHLVPALGFLSGVALAPAIATARPSAALAISPPAPSSALEAAPRTTVALLSRARHRG